jgi:hypothetical protein
VEEVESPSKPYQGFTLNRCATRIYLAGCVGLEPTGFDLESNRLPLTEHPIWWTGRESNSQCYLEGLDLQSSATQPIVASSPFFSSQPELNQQHPPYKRGTLPIELYEHFIYK